MTTTRLMSALFTLLFLLPTCSPWQVAPGTARPSPSPKPPAEPASAAADPSRRQALLRAPPLLALTVTPLFPALARAEGSAVPDLKFATTPSGLQVADVKVGSASSPSPADGQVVSVDYVMSTTGARYGSKIYSTVDAGAPYRWTLGDGSTIPGLEEAVRGMKPGGVRRAIIPAKLAYQAATADAREECVSGKGLGPVPPASEAVGEFQRFKNIYCNPDRVYQPDLVMDVKLYGKR